MSTPHVTYSPRPDATPEGEIASLANVYAFILACGEARRVQETKKAEGRLPSPDGPNDGPESKEDSADEPIIREV